MKNTDEALAKILSSLADKFGTTVDHLYAIMIRQAYIDGVECLLGITLVTILTSTMWVVMHKRHKAFDYDEYRSSYIDMLEDNVLLIVMTVVVTIAFLVTICVAGSQAIDCFYNPEYYALHQIIK